MRKGMRQPVGVARKKRSMGRRRGERGSVRRVVREGGYEGKEGREIKNGVRGGRGEEGRKGEQ